MNAADVERVARVLCAVLNGTPEGYDVWDAIGEADRQKCRKLATAAMRETRLIDAEALLVEARHVEECAYGASDQFRSVGMRDAADWLKGRAE
jgi:hypothetical protein